MQKLICPFCFNETLSMRFDKNLKPYFSCGLCCHKVFVRNSLAISGLICWSETLGKLDSTELRNLLMSSKGMMEKLKQDNPELEKWTHTEQASELTIENRRI